MNWSTRHKCGTEKNIQQESNLWTPKHQAGAPSTELPSRTVTHGEQGHFSLSHPRVMLINSPFITELKIHHLYSLITTHDDFDSADPSSMQDACHIWTQLKWSNFSCNICGWCMMLYSFGQVCATMLWQGMHPSLICNTQTVATLHNRVVKHVQHVAAQQCCDMLYWNVAIIWPGLANTGPTVLRYVALKCCNCLARALQCPDNCKNHKVRNSLCGYDVWHTMSLKMAQTMQTFDEEVSIDVTLETTGHPRL